MFIHDLPSYATLSYNTGRLGVGRWDKINQASVIQHVDLGKIQIDHKYQRKITICFDRTPTQFRFQRVLKPPGFLHIHFRKLTRLHVIESVVTTPLPAIYTHRNGFT